MPACDSSCRAGVAVVAAARTQSIDDLDRAILQPVKALGALLRGAKRLLRDVRD